MASQTFSHRARLEIGPHTAWERLQLADTWAEIGGMSEVVDVRHSPDGRLLGFSFAALIGGTRHPGTAATTTSHPPRSMSINIETKDLGGSIDVSLDESEIDVTLTVSSRGFFSSMMFPVISAAITNGLSENVERFASRG